MASFSLFGFEEPQASSLSNGHSNDSGFGSNNSTPFSSTPNAQYFRTSTPINLGRPTARESTDSILKSQSERAQMVTAQHVLSSSTEDIETWSPDKLKRAVLGCRALLATVVARYVAMSVHSPSQRRANVNRRAGPA